MMLRRMYPFWRPSLGDTAIGSALLMVAAGIELMQPWPIKGLVDYVFGSDTAPDWLVALWPSFGSRDIGGMIIGICLAVLLLVVAHRGTQLFSQYLLIRAGGRIVALLRYKVCEHLHRLSLTYHDQTKVGDSIYRAAYDTTAALSLVSQAVAPAITGVVLLVGILVIMVSLDWQLTLLTLGIAPCFWFLIRRFGNSIEKRSEHYQQSERDLVATLQESLSSIRVVQAFSREPDVSTQVEKQAGKSLSAIQRLVFVQLAFSACVGLAMGIGTAAMVGFGAHRVVTGQLSLGDVLVFLAYMGMLYQPMNAFSESINVIRTAKVQLRRIVEILDMPPQVADRPQAYVLPVVRGCIEFRNVGFSYEPGQPVLSGFNLLVEPGQVVALVGQTGAGKTTFASLLLRFYDPTEGKVLLDDHDLSELKLAWLRRQVSVVLQDTILFSATIGENIAYARPDASDEEIENASKLAQADEFIRNFPDGYRTMLGERGVNLSGGQRQRIAIARAYLKNAPILILDEPTSSLDSNTEKALMDALNILVKGRTTFIIAHRLSTVRLADKILVLENGRIVEQGSHDNLMKTGTKYRQFYQTQWGDNDPS